MFHEKIVLLLGYVQAMIPTFMVISEYAPVLTYVGNIIYANTCILYRDAHVGLKVHEHHCIECAQVKIGVDC